MDKIIRCTAKDGMIRIIGVAYDNFTNQDLNSF